MATHSALCCYANSEAGWRDSAPALDPLLMAATNGGTMAVRVKGRIDGASLGLLLFKHTHPFETGFPYYKARATASLLCDTDGINNGIQ